MAGPVKVITIESVEEKIKELEIVRDAITAALWRQAVTAEDTARSLYIKLQHAAKVADQMNSEDFRIPSKTGERKYTSSDVTDILNSSDDESSLVQLAKVLYYYNTGRANWNTVVKLCGSL